MTFLKYNRRQKMTEKTKETMLTYVEKSPEVIRENVKRSKGLTEQLVKEYTKKDYKTIWIVASGSSYNGSMCARYFIRKHLKTEVKIITPFTFVHAENYISDDDFVFVVSQSGYSTNSIDALNTLKDKGRKAIALTTNLKSDMINYADILIDYGIGKETVHYVTLGVTGFALFLMLFTIESALTKGVMDEKTADTLKNEIIASADVHETVQKQTMQFYQDNFLMLTAMNKAIICGLGSGMGVAVEAALKISETMRIPVLAVETEEYLHGITLQLDPHMTVFLVDTGLVPYRLRQIYEANKVATPSSFMITTNPEFMDDKTAVYVDTSISEEILPLCFLPYFQIIAYKITEDTSRWQKHPSYERLSKMIAGKTENYDSYR